MGGIMYKLKKKAQSRPETLRPGTYLARVTAVRTPDGYVDGTAFQITYVLITPDGREDHKHSEIFWNIAGNPRTEELSELMDAFGLQFVEDLVGKTIRASMKRNVTSRGTFLSMTNREPWLPDSNDSGAGT
jgi:hypothetical protein